MIYKTLTVIAATSFLVMAAPDAKATDKFDAWLNVYGTSDITITKLTDQSARVSTGQATLQNLEGTVESCPLRMRIQRGVSTGALDGGMFRSRLRNPKNITKIWTSIEESDISDFEKIKVRRGFGSAFTAKGWRYYAAAVKGGAGSIAGDAYEYLVIGAVCLRGWPALATYLKDTVDGVNREQNMADFAYFHGNTDATPAAQPEPEEYRNCLAADGSDRQMAAFMQSLSEDQLSRFLANGQSCDIFNG